MLEDLLNDQTSSNSIVIVDNFEKDSHLILSLFIKKLTERQNIAINIYPCDRHTLKYWTRFENKVRLNRTLLKSLFIERDKPIFESILNELDQDVRNFLVFDNINLIIRHLQGNPFLLFQFITAIRQQRNISGILMVLHEDSIDKTVINQLSLLVQTMIRICDTTLKPSDLTQFGSLNKHLFKYHLSIDNRSYRNFKIKNFDETLYLTEDVEILKIEKHIIKSNEKKPVEEEKEDEMLKGLTFNVHLSSDDLEAKRNLVLPYEIVGKPKKNEQKEPPTKEDSKIFYAPDERDDVDDDDPDDDLNF